MKRTNIVILILALTVVILTGVSVYFAFFNKTENVPTIGTNNEVEKETIKIPNKFYTEIPFEIRTKATSYNTEVTKYIDSYIIKQKNLGKYSESKLIATFDSGTNTDEDDTTYNTYKILIENKKDDKNVYELAWIYESDSGITTQSPEIYNSDDIDVISFYDKLHLVAKKIVYENKLVILGSEDFCIDCSAFGGQQSRIFIYNESGFQYLGNMLSYNEKTTYEISEDKKNIILMSTFGDGGSISNQYQYINIENNKLTEINIQTTIGYEKDDKAYSDYDLSKCTKDEDSYISVLDVYKNKKDEASLLLCNSAANEKDKIVINNKQLITLNNYTEEESAEQGILINYNSLNFDSLKYIIQLENGNIEIDSTNKTINKYER